MRHHLKYNLISNIYKLQLEPNQPWCPHLNPSFSPTCVFLCDLLHLKEPLQSPPSTNSARVQSSTCLKGYFQPTVKFLLHKLSNSCRLSSFQLFISHVPSHTATSMFLTCFSPNYKLKVRILSQNLLSTSIHSTVLYIKQKLFNKYC